MKTTNTQKVIGTFGVIAGLVIASSVYADTYTYVATNGELKTTNATTAAEAMLVSDIALHSGVIEASKTEVVTNTNTNFAATTYAYVDINGNVRYQNADSAAEAMTLADDKKATSGVMLVSE